MVENPETGTVQQSVPDFTSETQPEACRESRAVCVALSDQEGLFGPKKMHVALQVTLASVHSVFLVRVEHTGASCVLPVSPLCSDTVNVIQ